MFYLSAAPGDVQVYQGELDDSRPNTHANTATEAVNKALGQNLIAGLHGAANDSSNNEPQARITYTSSQVDAGQQTTSDYSQDLEPGAPRKTSKSCRMNGEQETPANSGLLLVSVFFGKEA